MKTNTSIFYVLFGLALINFFHSDTLAQENALPSTVNQNTTITTILEHLNNTIFPYARIGLESKGKEGYNPADPDNSDHRSEAAVFSQGFKLVATSGCHIALKNDNVKLLYFSSNGFGDHISFADYNHRKDTQIPYVAEFSTWLETVSYNKGKGSFKYTKDADKAKLLGTWRTEFTSRGFFKREVFSMSLKATQEGSTSETMDTENVTFTFDDKEMSERFDEEFRRLIILCQPQTTKPRWNR